MRDFGQRFETREMRPADAAAREQLGPVGAQQSSQRPETAQQAFGGLVATGPDNHAEQIRIAWRIPGVFSHAVMIGAWVMCLQPINLSEPPAFPARGWHRRARAG